MQRSWSSNWLGIEYGSVYKKIKVIWAYINAVSISKSWEIFSSFVYSTLSRPHLEYFGGAGIGSEEGNEDDWMIRNYILWKEIRETGPVWPWEEKTESKYDGALQLQECVRACLGGKNL